MTSLLNYKGKGVVLRHGELFLKGKNRHVFEDVLLCNTRRTVARRTDVVVRREHGRIFALGANDAALLDDLSSVFGIASISAAVFCAKDLEEITAAALELALQHQGGARTFRIAARRSDKKFPYTSTDIGKIVGAAVAQKTGLGVDLTRFDLAVGVEIGPQWAFVWSGHRPGAGGLPVGTSGQGMLLLSGGIDSPVAGHLMQKRGLKLSAVYFHAFPYTGDGAKQKVIALARILAKRQDRLKLFVVPFTKIQERFRETVNPKYLVILYRRTMMRIAEKLASREQCSALITGESLGQVASQTVANLSVIEEVASIPIFRPLIGFDKAETIVLAKHIGSFETSILPHDDCCSLFVPKHPETKARLPIIQAEEQKIEWHDEMDEATLLAELIEL